MIIRIGSINDLNQIYQIEQLCFLGSPWPLKMIQQELLDKNDCKTWIIESDKIIVGYCMVRLVPKEIHLINMAVIPSQQKMGIGQKLLNHFLDNTPPKTSVFLEVKRSNFPAINLYLNTGFEEIAVHEKYYSDGEDAIVMCLKI